MKKNNEPFITLNNSFKFHQEIQPTDKKSLQKKTEVFKKNLERRVENNLKILYPNQKLE